VLKAYSRVLEHLMLAGDLVIVVGCWLLAYVARFYLFGPARASLDIPPLGPYLIMILPIVVVWGISFQAFDLYRPRRIGSRLSEVADVAKASSLAALVLVTIMTFLFREYDFSRVVIVYFWLFSIAAVSFARNVFREGLRVARRRGYNLRYGLVVGSGELAQHVVERLRGRSDIGIQVVGVVGDAKEGTGGVPWLGAYADLSAVLAARPVDHVVIALAHEDASRLPGLLDAIGDEPVTIHVVPDLFRFTSLRGGVEEFEGIPFVHLRESPLHGWNAVAKRVFDALATARRPRGGGAAHLQGARALPSGPHGAGRSELPDAQVPDHEGGRRERVGSGVGAGGRSAPHAHWDLSPALQPRRAAAVRQRAAG
jgi:FlaA1/EpsC-like NDP-sugar epimerase